MQTKLEIRKNLVKKRRMLNTDEAVLKSEDICQSLIATLNEFSYENILLYSSVNNEVDLSCFFNYLQKKKKKIFFPRVHVGTNYMDFYRVDSLDDLKLGSFNIKEPTENENTKFLENEEGLLLVPGVAFSLKMYRIGYGQGFYDRYLSTHKNIKAIGVCYDFQIVSDWESDEFDVALDCIITENRKVF